MRRHFLGMTERRFYQLAKRQEAPGVQLWGVAIDEKPGARGGFLLAGQDYSGSDAAAVLEWVFERTNGYKKLAATILPWPRSLALSDREGATWPARTVRADTYDWTIGTSAAWDAHGMHSESP